MAYLSSDKVYIYPVFNRQSGINPESKLNTEFNLTAALASIISENSGCFVISWSSPHMKIFMHGYYIELDLTEITTRPLYAHLHLSGDRGGTGYKNIIEVKPATGSGTALDDDLDDDDKPEFVGLTLDDSTNGGSYTLQLLDRDGKVPASSYWKFSQNDINISPDSAGTESYPSLVWDDVAKKMKTINLSGISLTDNGKGTTFISSLEQSPSGKLSGKTKSFTLVEGTNQGQIQLNGTNIDIKGLQSTSEPTFSSLTTGSIVVDSDAEISGDLTLSGSINSYNLNTGSFSISRTFGGTITSIKTNTQTNINYDADLKCGVVDVYGDTLTFSGNPTIEGNNTTLSLNANTTINYNSQSGNSSIQIGSKTLTLLGNATLASGNYGAVNDEGSEQITVAGKSFNVVTRNTPQTISGDKTFSGTTTLGNIGDGNTVNFQGNVKMTSLSSDEDNAGVIMTNNSGVVSNSTATVGTSVKPVYLSKGKLTACSWYAGGTRVTLNGELKGATTASLYAPTDAGTEGQILKSKGSGNAPEWGGLYEHRFSIEKYVASADTYSLRSVVRFSITTSKSAKYLTSSSHTYDISTLAYYLFNLGYTGTTKPLVSSGLWYDSSYASYIISGITAFADGGAYKLGLQYGHQTDNMQISLSNGDAYIYEEIRPIL